MCHRFGERIPKKMRLQVQEEAIIDGARSWKMREAVGSSRGCSLEISETIKDTSFSQDGEEVRVR